MSRPTALVSAARGIGDILRVTPLVRVCAPARLRRRPAARARLRRRSRICCEALRTSAESSSCQALERRGPSAARRARSGSATTSRRSRTGACRSGISCARGARWPSSRRYWIREGDTASSAASRARLDGPAAAAAVRDRRRRGVSACRPAPSRCTRAANRTGRGRSGTASTSSPRGCRTWSSSGRRTISTERAHLLRAAVPLAAARSGFLGQARSLPTPPR